MRSSLKGRKKGREGKGIGQLRPTSDTHLGNGSIKGRLIKKQRLLQGFSLAHALKGLPPSNTFM